jgi:hypothetical protein
MSDSTDGLLVHLLNRHSLEADLQRGRNVDGFQLGNSVSVPMAASNPAGSPMFSSVPDAQSGPVGGGNGCITDPDAHIPSIEFEPEHMRKDVSDLMETRRSVSIKRSSSPPTFARVLSDVVADDSHPTGSDRRGKIFAPTLTQNPSKKEVLAFGVQTGLTSVGSLGNSLRSSENPATIAGVPRGHIYAVVQALNRSQSYRVLGPRDTRPLQVAFAILGRDKQLAAFKTVLDAVGLTDLADKIPEGVRKFGDELAAKLNNDEYFAKQFVLYAVHKMMNSKNRDNANTGGRSRVLHSRQYFANLLTRS